MSELVHRRVFHAPVALVWRCLTEPAELVALHLPAVAPDDAVTAVRDLLVASGGTWFKVDPAGLPEDTDPGSQVSLLAGRTLPDGRSLPRT